jgi:sortase A
MTTTTPDRDAQLGKERLDGPEVRVDGAADAERAGRSDAADEIGAGADEATMDAVDVARQGRRRALLITASTWARNIGALFILFAAWQLWGTAIAQHNSQVSLKSQFDASFHGHHHGGSAFSLLPAAADLANPPSGAPLALITSPKIGLDQIVVAGTSTSALDLGPGHYIGTALPGQAGNVAIAGHRTTHGAPFNRLAELAPGDPIYLTDLAGQRLTYTVALTPFPVSPSNTSVLNYFGDDRLTLTTCNPEFSARQRLIVVATFKSGPGKSPTRPVKADNAGRPYKVALQGEAGWNGALLPAVLLEIGLLVALGLTNRRCASLLGRDTRWLVLVPIWTAGLFLLFQSLTGFLPAAA